MTIALLQSLKVAPSKTTSWKIEEISTAGSSDSFLLYNTGMAKIKPFLKFITKTVEEPQPATSISQARLDALVIEERFNDFSDPAWDFWNNDYDAEYDKFI